MTVSVEKLGADKLVEMWVRETHQELLLEPLVPTGSKAGWSEESSHQRM